MHSSVVSPVGRGLDCSGDVVREVVGQHHNGIGWDDVGVCLLGRGACVVYLVLCRCSSSIL